MKVQIQDITLKTLFKIAFAVYLILGMHFDIDHLGGYGLYLPFNTVGWIFISLLIGFGCWEIRNSGKIIFSRFQIICWIGIGLMCLPLFYPNNENAGLVLHRFLGLGLGSLSIQHFSNFVSTGKIAIGFFILFLGVS